MTPSPEIPCLNPEMAVSCGTSRNGHPIATVSDIDLLHEALYGERGEDQKRIALHGLAWISLLLVKNHDYGSSVWKAPILVPDLEPGDGILVRASDKIARVLTLLGAENPQVAGESIEDTIRDLGAYCLLYLARPKE